MSRRPKPIALRKYENNYYPSQHGTEDQEIQGTNVLEIKSPDSIDDEAKELFQAFVKPLCLIGLIKEYDVPQLIMAAFQIDMILKLQTEADIAVKISDKLQIINTLDRTITSFSNIAYHYCVSPAERQKIITQVKSGKAPRTIKEKLLSKNERQNDSTPTVQKRSKKQSE